MNQLIMLSMIILAGCGQDKNKHPDDLQHTTPPEIPQQQADAERKHVYITNLATHIRELRLNKFHDDGIYGENVTVAVLDNGFMDLDLARGKSLPPDIKIEDAPVNEPAFSQHGTRMAEIVYGLATGTSLYDPARRGPRILLYNTNGFSNFKHAVSEVIRNRVDIVLYSQVWQYGGNFDGEGFINAEVNRALENGILWVNAAGNFANTTYNTNVRLTGDSEVVLPDTGNSLQFSVAYPQTPTKIVASWSDFQNSEHASSQIDLDMYVYDQNNQLIASSELVQGPPSGDSTRSQYPRELINKTLDSGLYRIKVKAKSAHTIPSDLQVRLSIDGEGVTISRSEPQRSIMVPADNPHVLTVGALNYSHSSSDPSLPPGKPEVSINSNIAFEDGYNIESTSTAAAIIAGTLSLYQAKHRNLTKESFISRLYESGIDEIRFGIPERQNQNPSEIPSNPNNPMPGQPGQPQNGGSSNNPLAPGQDFPYPPSNGGQQDDPRRPWENPRGPNNPPQQGDGRYDRPQQPPQNDNRGFPWPGRGRNEQRPTPNDPRSPGDSYRNPPQNEPPTEGRRGILFPRPGGQPNSDRAWWPFKQGPTPPFRAVN